MIKKMLFVITNMKYSLKAQQRGKMSTAEGKKFPILSVHFKPSYSLSLGIFL